MLQAYLQRISAAVEFIASANVDYYREQILSPTRANLRFRLSWPDGAVLEVSEALEVGVDSLDRLSYRYHFQNAARVVRYDNAPHYPHLPGYPNHKHESAAIVPAACPGTEP